MSDAGIGATVRIEPLGVTIQTRKGEPLMRAAQRSGLRWPTICNGAAQCGACHVRVVEAEVPPSLPGEKERRQLLILPPPYDRPGERLACQLVLQGECVVEKSGVQAKHRTDGETI